jgi:transposase
MKIHIFKENMNSDIYIDILKENLLAFYKNNPNLIFQDDNDPKHRSHKTIEWKKNNNINNLDWPANSPDLNPIENIWAILKTEIGKLFPKNVDEFTNSITIARNNIDKKIIDKTIDSLPARIAKVIEANGGSIDY